MKLKNIKTPGYLNKYKETNKMKILTYNIQTSLIDHPARIGRIIDEIKTTKAQAICLQEVSTPHMRNQIIDLLGQDYHMTFSHNYDQGRLRVFALLPTVVFASIAIFGQLFAPIFCPLFFRIACLFAAVCFFPYFTLHVLGVFNEHFRLGAERRIDRQGLCLAVRKADFAPIQIISKGVFESPGYSCEFSVMQWFLFTFLKPGYLFVSTVDNRTGEKIVIGNAHLALEGDYCGRLAQAEELIRLAEDSVEDVDASCCFIGCDLNSADDIAFDTMNEHMCNLTGDTGGAITWDCANPRTQSMLWDTKSHILSRQIDYIWCSQQKSQKSLKTVDVQIIGNRKDQELSDHYGLCVEVD